MIVNKTTVRQAVEQLSQDQRFVTRVKDIRKLVDNWEIQPLVFAGDLILYNVLVEVGLGSRDKMEALFKAAEARRPQTPASTKSNYQRRYMRERRRRLSKAVKVHEARTGYSLSRKEAEAVRKSIQSKWAAARDRYVLEGGDLSWEEKNLRVQDFWNQVDDALDRALEEGHEREVHDRAYRESE